MLKYIVAIFLIIAAWASWAFFLELNVDYIWAPALVTLLVVLVLAAILIARRLRARRAARELEKALAAQAAEQARTARPDMQAEILQMQAEFQKAIKALKSSKIAAEGENALYALPWNLIVGPPGAGKTTALRNSGLQFPYMSTSGGGVRGVGGTRNCDWWLTNEAVLLDTAGRWTTEDEDRDEWIGFLDLIKKFRPEKPLNGIIAAIALDQVGGAHEEEIGSLARRMRERIDEVQNRLQMSLPVYVLFTKADLVPGFVESFSDLGKQERGQVWGFTVPLADAPADAALHFTERFDELNTIVEKRSLRRMGDERKIETRELIHSFPQQFSTLRRNCTTLISEVFEGSVYGETPLFRGVYFSSGTQEGRPIDRVMHKMAEAFGIRSEVNLGEPVTEAKSYFLRDVFLNVIFPDRDVANRSASELRRQRRNTFIAAGAIFGTALLMSILPAIAWARNRAFIAETDEIVTGVSTAVEESEGEPLTAEELSPLRERLGVLKRHDARGAPITMRMGLYPDDLLDPVEGYYTRLLREQVVGPIFTADAEAMGESGRHFEAYPDEIPNGPEHAVLYDQLKMHLLLSRPVEGGEPSTADDEDSRDWLAEHLARRWLLRLGGEEEVEESTQEAMEEHARAFVASLGREDNRREEDPTTVPPETSMRFPREDESVTRARRALTRVSVTDMALERIVQDVEPLGYDLRLANLVGTVDPMQSDGIVRGAFTRRAWVARVREMLQSPESRVFGEPWVLGAEAEQSTRSAEQREEDLRNLRNSYFSTYITEWTRFLGEIRVVPAQGNNIQTLANLQHLSRGEPEPYRRLFRQVLFNTTLPDPEADEDSEEGDDRLSETAIDIFWRRVRRLGRGGRLVDRLLRNGGAGPGADGEEELELTAEHVYIAFEGFTRVGATPPPPPPPEGQEPPPPPPVPLGQYEEQLHAVRDALQTHLDTPAGTAEGLETALATARTSTTALIESQQVGWRPRLLALLWPPIEGAARSVAMEGAAGAGRSWCTEVYMPYHRNLLDGYPMNPAGHDVPLADFGAFYMREGGTLWAFYDEVLQRRVPKEGDTFMFATNLGQQASNAYRRQLLQYLERANDITNTFFPPGSEEGPTVQFDARIMPSIRVATQELCVGGSCYEHHNGPERWHRYTWPGESPEGGASLEIRGAGGIHERIEQTGEWGLYRLLEQATVTSNSTGHRVFTMTWRLRDHDLDVEIQIRPVRGDAPFFGIRGRSRNPAFLQPVRGRDVDPPQQIVSGRTTCRVR